MFQDKIIKKIKVRLAVETSPSSPDYYYNWPQIILQMIDGHQPSLLEHDWIMSHFEDWE